MENEHEHHHFTGQVIEDFSSQAKWARFVSIVVIIIFVLITALIGYSIPKGAFNFDLPEVWIALGIAGGFILLYLVTYFILLRASISLTQFTNSEKLRHFFVYTEQIKWYYVLGILASILLVIQNLI